MEEKSLLKIIDSELKNESIKSDLDILLSFPRKAQELILATMSDMRTSCWYFADFLYTKDNIAKMSPIEIIFSVAFSIYKEFTPHNSIADRIIKNGFLYSQETIKINDKNYIPDFLFVAADSDFEFNEIGKIKNVKVVVECDGHEFHHKNKEQVTHDNEREYNLKVAGYDVIRFSGSQVHNNPLECAQKAYEYMKAKITNALGENDNE